MRNDLIAIAAMAGNRVIGKGLEIPWHISADLRRFKKLTEGHVVVMGRKTYESIGAPLPKRTNFVLSKEKLQGVVTIPDLAGLEKVLNAYVNRKVFVIGGAQVYEQLLPYCSELHLTLIYGSPEGDILMPEFNKYFAGFTLEESSQGYEFRHYLKHAPKNFVRTGNLEEHVQVSDQVG